MTGKRLHICIVVLIVSFALIFLALPAETEGAAAAQRHPIHWLFYTYAEPDFRSERRGAFAPQEVAVFHKFGGWALINTIDGDRWVYTAADKMFIDRVLPIHNKEEETVIGRINPQVVEIIERRGRWLKINSLQEAGWVYLDFQLPVRELENFMRQFGNAVSLYYENLESGFVFRHNAEQVFFGASATKANFALYIYQKAERDENAMDRVHTFTAGDYWIGSGFIRQRYSPGAGFTQRELLHLMLSPSDNIATRILRRVHGLNGFREFIESIGGNTDFIQTLTYSRLSADEAGLIMREIHAYIESGGRYSHELRDNLLANRYPFIISDHPVASKSGWADNFGGAYHDMAVVYAPSPYILAILSSKEGTVSDRRVFESISMFIQEFNDRWFVPVLAEIREERRSDEGSF